MNKKLSKDRIEGFLKEYWSDFKAKNKRHWLFLLFMAFFFTILSTEENMQDVNLCYGFRRWERRLFFLLNFLGTGFLDVKTLDNPWHNFFPLFILQGMTLLLVNPFLVRPYLFFLLVYAGYFYVTFFPCVFSPFRLDWVLLGPLVQIYGDIMLLVFLVFIIIGKIIEALVWLKNLIL